MKVSELIKALQKLPQDVEAIVAEDKMDVEEPKTQILVYPESGGSFLTHNEEELERILKEWNTKVIKRENVVLII